jgi:hypothetical protein
VGCSTRLYNTLDVWGSCRSRLKADTGADKRVNAARLSTVSIGQTSPMTASHAYCDRDLHCWKSAQLTMVSHQKCHRSVQYVEECAESSFAF